MPPHAISLIVILILTLAAPIGLASAQPQKADTFYFHFLSETYRNDNESVIVVEDATSTPPAGSTPRVLEVAASIKNATTIFGTIWVGSIAWVTRPLTQPAMVSGSATFTVWLSSDDVTPSFSGVGAGVAVLDQENQTVGNYHYSFDYAHGKILTGSPTLYSFNVQLDQLISPDQRLVFAVGVGSTTQGWRMDVYFDDLQYPSHVLLPTNITVVPEFEPSRFLLTALIAVVLALTITRQVSRVSQRERTSARMRGFAWNC
jgi:hypothetical protein